MSGHTPAKLDTEICDAAGCLINWVQMFAGGFFLEKNPRVLPYTTSKEPLPSFKIATINQEDFKGYNAQFHGRLFQLPANVIPISPLRYCIPPPPPSACLSLIPAPFALLLISIGRLPCLSTVTRLKPLLHFWWGRSALKDPEQERLSPDKYYLNLRGESLS